MDKILQLLASMPTKEMGTYGGGSWSAPDVAKMTGADKVIGALQRKLGKAYGPAKFLGEVATYPVTAPLEAAYKVGNIYGQEFKKGPKGSPNKAMVKSMAASAPVLALMGAGALGKAAGKAVFGGPMESAARYRQISKIAPSSLPYAQYQVLKKLGGNKAYDLGSALTYGLHKTLAGRNTAGKILDAMVQGAGGVAPIGGASELSKSLEKNTPVRDAFMNILGGLGKGAAGGALLGGALAGGKIAGQAGKIKLDKLAQQARNKQIRNLLFGREPLSPGEKGDLEDILSMKNMEDVRHILKREYTDKYINKILPEIAKLKGLNVTSKKAGMFDKLSVLENLVRKQNALEKRATTTGVNPKTDYQSQIDSLSSELEGNLSGKNSPMIEAFVKKLTKQQGSFTPFAPIKQNKPVEIKGIPVELTSGTKKGVGGQLLVDLYGKKKISPDVAETLIKTAKENKVPIRVHAYDRYEDWGGYYRTKKDINDFLKEYVGKKGMEKTKATTFNPDPKVVKTMEAFVRKAKQKAGGSYKKAFDEFINDPEDVRFRNYFTDTAGFEKLITPKGDFPIGKEGDKAANKFAELMQQYNVAKSILGKKGQAGFADLFGKVGGKADRWSKYHKDSSGMLTDKWGNHPLSKSDYKRQMGDWALYRYQRSKNALSEGLTKAQKEALKKIGLK